MVMEVSGILVAAHELKAPLASMRQLALSLELADTDSERQKIQSQLVNISERALRQVNDLAKIARLEDGFFATEPVSIRGVCQEVVSEISPFFQSNNRRIKMIFTNKPRLVVANHDLLESIIYNFCVNAAHYSNEETTSRIEVMEKTGKIRVSVRDFGPALPTEIYRAITKDTLAQPTAIAMRPGSTGLGLYISAQFAKHLRAKMGAVRHRDGTSFFVEVPISKQMSWLEN